MGDYIDDIIGAVCDNIVLNSKYSDFDVDDYDEVRERVQELVDDQMLA